jgi:hypothetical protein
LVDEIITPLLTEECINFILQTKSFAFIAKLY